MSCKSPETVDSQICLKQRLYREGTDQMIFQQPEVGIVGVLVWYMPAAIVDTGSSITREIIYAKVYQGFQSQKSSHRMDRWIEISTSSIVIMVMQ